MVRLKVFIYYYLSYTHHLISIPYGAIKRHCVQGYVQIVHFIFQFLMVRLKGSYEPDHLAILGDFNSLWCD